MGQQQIMLLVLAVILVGIAVTIGLISFQSKAVQSNRDAVITDLNYLASDAQAYYKKTGTYGGGDQSFLGYDIPEQLKRNDNGDYSIVATQSQKITIQGIGKEKEGVPGCGQTGNITYRIIIEPNKISLQKII
jgi:Tfp pilus assembly protein PilE